ncbi:YHS domain protein [Rhodobacteraceae bacterium R_SAG10]|nr:YHS domain protein [Rhodobacteraceae bacterium R_SAG10]
MTSRRTFLTAALSLPALYLTQHPALAAIPEFFNTDGLGASGYDVVAYFAQSDAVAGDEQFSLQWKGAVWRFGSGENMAMFESYPRAFAPQYGGYCAFAMAKGAIARSVPAAWTVYEGKLYLNQSRIVRALWKRDIPGFLAAADKVWPDILQR